MPACCLTCSTHTSMTKGVRVFCSSGTGCCLLFPSDSCKSSFTECRLVAKFLRSVDSLLTWDISAASHFPLEVEASCEQHLGSSEYHQRTKLGLLMNSKSHTEHAQRELDENGRPGHCLSCKALSCTVQKSGTSLPALVSWMNAFGVIYERSDPGQVAGGGLYGSLELLWILTFSLATFRQRICHYLGLWVLQLIFICIISLSRNVKVILN